MLHSRFQSHRPLVLEKIFKGFLPYGGHLGHVTQIPQTNYPTHRCSTCNLALIGQVVKENMMFENNGQIHVYRLRVGADHPSEVKIFS